MKKSNIGSLEITVRGMTMRTTLEIITMNYRFVTTYLEAGGNLGDGDDVVCDSFEAYMDLLVAGKIKYFNPELNVPLHSLMLVDEVNRFGQILAFCVNNEIAFTPFMTNIYGAAHPTIIVHSGVEDYRRIKHFCIDNHILVSEGVFGK